MRESALVEPVYKGRMEKHSPTMRNYGKNMMDLQEHNTLTNYDQMLKVWTKFPKSFNTGYLSDPILTFTKVLI